MNWKTRFSQPVILPDGQMLQNLLEAGAYIARLPDATYRTEKWRVATHLLIEAAEESLPVEFAHYAIKIATELNDRLD